MMKIMYAENWFADYKEITMAELEKEIAEAGEGVITLTEIKNNTMYFMYKEFEC